MLQAPILKKGDTVRIISTARKISKEEIHRAVMRIESWGLKVVLGQNIFAVENQFAGIKEQRKADLQMAIDDQETKAIICARGGYGTVQLIDSIDFEGMMKHPKWLVGYSDVTVLHNHLNQKVGIESLHATMPINFLPLAEEDLAAESLRKALFGEELKYEFVAEMTSILTFDRIEATIVGGNLSILYSMSGSESQLSTKGKILFIEDLDEYLYHIDRMMMNLKRSGLLDGCRAILVGGMSDMNDNAIPYGKTAQEIIIENTKELGMPVVFGVPAGHIKNNLALIMGRQVCLSRKDNNIQLKFYGRT